MFWSGHPDLNRRFVVLRTAALGRLAIPAIYRGAICIRLPVRRMERATRVARNRDGCGRICPLFNIREVGGSTGLEPARNSLKGCLLDDFAFDPGKNLVADAHGSGSWYTRGDSNSHFPVSKTGAFADLATRANENLVRAAGFEPANTCFQNKPI